MRIPATALALLAAALSAHARLAKAAKPAAYLARPDDDHDGGAHAMTGTMKRQVDPSSAAGRMPVGVPVDTSNVPPAGVAPPADAPPLPAGFLPNLPAGLGAARDA